MEGNAVTGGSDTETGTPPPPLPPPPPPPRNVFTSCSYTVTQLKPYSLEAKLTRLICIYMHAGAKELLMSDCDTDAEIGVRTDGAEILYGKYQIDDINLRYVSDGLQRTGYERSV